MHRGDMNSATKTDILGDIGAAFDGVLTAAVEGNAYYRGPDGIVRFVEDVIGTQPTDYQGAILSALVRDRYVSVRGPRGMGKSALASWVVLWGMGVFPKDWDVKIITTASSFRQVEKFLWPEIHKWAYRTDWTKVGLRVRKGQELLGLSFRLPNKEAFGAATDNPALLEGAHARVIIFIFDEAKEIPDEIFDAMEGAFSQEGLHDHFVYVLALSTPGESAGRFYDIQTGAPGHEHWTTFHVTLQDTIDAGQVSPQWADKLKNQWGEDNVLYQRHVLANFASSIGQTVIPLRWVELANERWLAWFEDGGAGPEKSPAALGCDPGGQGENADATGIAEFEDFIVKNLYELHRWDEIEIKEEIKARNEYRKKWAAIDSIGLGSGIITMLRKEDYPVMGVNVSEATTLTDAAGENQFINLRSALWWLLREYLDPNMPRGFNVALPPNDVLTGELIVPRWKEVGRGFIQVEGKPDIRKRLGGKSTNLADGVMLAMYASLMGSNHGIWL